MPENKLKKDHLMEQNPNQIQPDPNLVVDQLTARIAQLEREKAFIAAQLQKITAVIPADLWGGLTSENESLPQQATEGGEHA